MIFPNTLILDCLSDKDAVNFDSFIKIDAHRSNGMSEIYADSIHKLIRLSVNPKPDPDNHWLTKSTLTSKLSLFIQSITEDQNDSEGKHDLSLMVRDQTSLIASIKNMSPEIFSNTPLHSLLKSGYSGNDNPLVRQVLNSVALPIDNAILIAKAFSIRPVMAEISLLKNGSSDLTRYYKALSAAGIDYANDNKNNKVIIKQTIGKIPLWACNVFFEQTKSSNETAVPYVMGLIKDVFIDALNGKSISQSYLDEINTFIKSIRSCFGEFEAMIFNYLKEIGKSDAKRNLEVECNIFNDMLTALLYAYSISNRDEPLSLCESYIKNSTLAINGLTIKPSEAFAIIASNYELGGELIDIHDELLENHLVEYVSRFNKGVRHPDVMLLSDVRALDVNDIQYEIEQYPRLLRINSSSSASPISGNIYDIGAGIKDRRTNGNYSVCHEILEPGGMSQTNLFCWLSTMKDPLSCCTKIKASIDKCAQIEFAIAGAYLIMSNDVIGNDEAASVLSEVVRSYRRALDKRWEHCEILEYLIGADKLNELIDEDWFVAPPNEHASSLGGQLKSFLSNVEPFLCDGYLSAPCAAWVEKNQGANETLNMGRLNDIELLTKLSSLDDALEPIKGVVTEFDIFKLVRQIYRDNKSTLSITEKFASSLFDGYTMFASFEARRIIQTERPTQSVANSAYLPKPAM